MPLSEATLSRSPNAPQLQRGRGWPATSRPSIGMWTWPSSPAMPEAPRTIAPFSITPPPSPVPTIAEIEERSVASSPNCCWWAYRAAALPSLL